MSSETKTLRPGSAGPVSEVWRGRLAAGLDPRARRMNDSLPVDGRLWKEELLLTDAYGRSLHECGILSEADLSALLQAARDLREGLEAGSVTLEGEDVHSAVEAALHARCGDPAHRLHTGRSRNDQVATLLRRHVMTLCDDALAGIREIERALVTLAREAGDHVMAGATHLQPAQPLMVAHVWMSYAHQFERDEIRFQAAREAADCLPLGAGAIAGTPLVYDRKALAGRMGFTRLAANSLDAVSDRDFALEYLNAASVFGLHLSRLAEDLVLWCSPGFGWIAPPDGFSTGSSLLPQKKNPDLFELARGKAARLITNAQRLQVVLKGLPSSYQKDLQEDKETVFDTGDTLSLIFEAIPPALAAIRIRPERMAEQLTFDLLAVELADHLVEAGTPFRQAHALVGQLWAAAETAGVDPRELPDAERLGISAHFTGVALDGLTVERALGRRNHSPGTGPESVRAQLRRAEARLGLGPAVESAPAQAMPGSPVLPLDTAAISVRRARPADVPGIAALMGTLVGDGTLLPRPLADLYPAVREFHVAVSGDDVVACAALKLLWKDLGEVRSLVVRPELKGKGFGRQLVERVVADARELGLERVIALTREVAFFERSGFTTIPRDTLPRKVWTDCVNCPRRHACDETAVVMDLVPGATERARVQENGWILPLPPPR